MDGKIEAVRQHLATGSDVNAKTNDGESPLIGPSLANITETAALAKAKQKWHPRRCIAIESNGGWSGSITPMLHPMEYFSNRQSRNVATGTAVNAKKVIGWTSLYYAALKGRKETVRTANRQWRGCECKGCREGDTLCKQVTLKANKEMIELLTAKGSGRECEESSREKHLSGFGHSHFSASYVK